MKRALGALVAGTILSGLAAAVSTNTQRLADIHAPGPVIADPVAAQAAVVQAATTVQAAATIEAAAATRRPEPQAEPAAAN